MTEHEHICGDVISAEGCRQLLEQLGIREGFPSFTAKNLALVKFPPCHLPAGHRGEHVGRLASGYEFAWER